MSDTPMVTRAAREQANIALELVPPASTAAIRSLAAAIHRLADLVDYLDERVTLLLNIQAKAGELRDVDAEPVEK